MSRTGPDDLCPDHTYAAQLGPIHTLLGQQNCCFLLVGFFAPFIAFEELKHMRHADHVNTMHASLPYSKPGF